MYYSKALVNALKKNASIFLCEDQSSQYSIRMRKSNISRLICSSLLWNDVQMDLLSDDVSEVVQIVRMLRASSLTLL